MMRWLLVGERLRRHPGLVGGDQDRRAVLVGAGDHQDVVTGHPHVPAEDVGGHAETGDVADVARAVGVRPGDGGQDMSHVRQCIDAPGASHHRLCPQRARRPEPRPPAPPPRRRRSGSAPGPPAPVRHQVDAEPGGVVPAPDPGQGPDRLLATLGGVGVDGGHDAARAALHRAERRLHRSGPAASRPRPRQGARSRPRWAGSGSSAAARRPRPWGPGEDRVVERGQRLLGGEQQRVAVGEGHRVVRRRRTRGRVGVAWGRRTRPGATSRPSTSLSHAPASGAARTARSGRPEQLDVVEAARRPVSTTSSGSAPAALSRSPVGGDLGVDQQQPVDLAGRDRRTGGVDDHPAPVPGQPPGLDAAADASASPRPDFSG